MIEFAIVTPLAVLLIFAIIEFGLVYIAKLNLNHATFMAAREAATKGGTEREVKESLIKGLIPLYQDASINDPSARISKAYAVSYAKNQNIDIRQGLESSVKRLSPTKEAFADFGLKDRNGKIYIPNDNLMWRKSGSANSPGSRSGMTLQEANLLKVKVEYGYMPKTDIVRTVIKNVMCARGEGLEAFGSEIPIWQKKGDIDDCLKYYMHGRIKLVSYATVHMQSDVYEN
jgi:hypothetical protein